MNAIESTLKVNNNAITICFFIITYHFAQKSNNYYSTSTCTKDNQSDKTKRKNDYRY